MGLFEFAMQPQKQILAKSQPISARFYAPPSPQEQRKYATDDILTFMDKLLKQFPETTVTVDKGLISVDGLVPPPPPCDNPYQTTPVWPGDRTIEILLNGTREWVHLSDGKPKRKPRPRKI